MTIYLDIVFIENLALNCIILISTAKFLKMKVRIIKIILSSFIGTIFSILNLIFPLGNFRNFLYKIFISIVMIKIIYRNNSIKELIKKLLFFYLVSFIYGGLTMAMLYIVNPNKIVINNFGYFEGFYVIKIIIISAILGLLLIYIVTKYINEKNFKKRNTCNVEIIYKDKLSNIRCFIDTGNFLKEPITNRSVIIVEKKCIRNLVNEDIAEFINNISSGNNLPNNKVNKNIYVIPYSTIGSESSLLVGFKPDCVKIDYDEKIIIKNVLIGIYDGIISESGLYNGLIGTDILSE